MFYKQRDNLFLTGFAFNMPTCLLRIPFSLLESFIWTVIAYYVVGLAPEADRCGSLPRFVTSILLRNSRVRVRLMGDQGFEFYSCEDFVARISV